MKLYGLIGEKLGHSLSCEIHNYIFNKSGFQANYCLMPIKRGNLSQVIPALKILGYSGINVTIPYKEEIKEYLDFISPEAEKIGAINTVKIENTGSAGHNTDYYGFGYMLTEAGVNVSGKDAIILGGGGAAKAIIAYLLDNNVNSLKVVSRNPEYLGKLKDRYPTLEILDYNDESLIKGHVLINATPVGMYPKANASPVSEKVIKGFGVCADIVYNPASTRFLEIAKSNGAVIAGGLNMLIGQAVKASEIFQNVTLDEKLSKELWQLLKGRY